MDARVLNRWEPTKYSHEAIRAEFTEMLRTEYGLIESDFDWSAEVRGPDHHRYFHDASEAMVWHQDGTGAALIGLMACDTYLVCWANTMPTLVQDRKGDITHGADCEVVIFDNKTCLHRGPNGINAPDAERWFVRIHLTKNETTTKLLKGTN